MWDGSEKFNKYVEWLEYLIEHFLGPWGYRLNGKVTWAGEDESDVGTIVIVDNVVMIGNGWRRQTVRSDHSEGRGGRTC